MKVKPQTDYHGVGWKHATDTEVRFFLDPMNFTEDRLGMARIKTGSDTLNLRSQPEIIDESEDSESNIIETLKNDELYPIIDQTDDWYKLKTKDNIGWSSKDYIATPPTPISNNSIYQFLDLSKPANVSPIYLNKFAKDKGVLSGQGRSYQIGSQTHNINEIYPLSHSILETGHGKSQLASGLLVDKNGRIFDDYGRYINSKGNFVGADGKLLKDGQAPVIAQGPYITIYNVFGIGAVDADPLMLGAQRAFERGWTSVDKAIIGGADFVSKDYVYNNYNQNTLYKMRWNPGNLSPTATKQYATDIAWAYKQVNNMYYYYNQSSGYTLYFDIPVYKLDPIPASTFLVDEKLEEDNNKVDQEDLVENIEEEADLSQQEIEEEKAIIVDQEEDMDTVIDEVDEVDEKETSE